MNADREPHWERGKRVHGYWVELVQVGAVLLPAGRMVTEYFWTFGGWRPCTEVIDNNPSESTLKKAKRRVENLWQSWRRANPDGSD